MQILTSLIINEFFFCKKATLLFENSEKTLIFAAVKSNIKQQRIWKIIAGWALWTRAKAHSRERTLEARMSQLQKVMRLRQNRWTAAHSNVATPARIITPEVKLWSWEYFLSLAEYVQFHWFLSMICGIMIKIVKNLNEIRDYCLSL